MTSHPPFPYQRTSSDFQRESRGVFRVLHDKGLALDCTYDRPELRALDTCSERPLRWLWQDKIPLGKLTLIEGPPAVGKLFVALDIAARVSTGALCADIDYSPREVPARAEDEPPIQPPPDAPLAAGEDGEGTAWAKVDSAVEMPAPQVRGRQGEGETRTKASGSEAVCSPCLPVSPSPFLRPGSTPNPGVISGMDHLGAAAATPVASAQSESCAPPPEPSPEPPADSGHSVVLICDSWQAEDMIAPRLRMLGANQERIVTFTEVDCTDQCGGHRHSRPIRFPLDRPMFEYILRQHRGCRLIVIDNLENYCESPRQLRQAIRELDETAIYFGVAIVATLQGNVRFAPDGTIRDTARTIDGPARCIWCLTPDAAHPGLLRLEPKRMAFCKKPEGIACRIGDAGQVLWEPLPPYEKPPTEAARRKKLEHIRMLTWLGATLGTGVVLAETIYDAGKERGFSKNRLIAAREELAARTFKYGFGRAGAWMWTLKPQSEVTDAEIQAAYLDLPKDFPLDLKEVLEKSVPGRDGVVDEAAVGSATSAAQESENFGVLNKNGRKMAGSRTLRPGRKRSDSYAGLSLAQLRELGLQMLGLSARPRQESCEEVGHHVGNGRSGNSGRER